jgi:O-antigen/teichoic acid export membrane protein
LQKSKLLLNSIAAVGQVLVVGILYFVLYRYLLDTIGIELLGVWSLIIASTSLALLANFGISTSIVKFVSTYFTRKDFDSLKKLIFTSSVFIIVTYSLISILIFFLGGLILPHFIEKKYIAIALEILPYSLISLIINALGGVISSCLDGIQKNYVKSYIVSFSTLLLFGLSLLLTPKYGLKGLVFAQIIQAILVLLLSVYQLSKSIKGVLILRWNWSSSLFKEIINYGLKMQALSFMQMSFEPITKALLSKYGGLASVGYYEMASRLVTQLRGLIVSANQVIVPVVAEAKETDEKQIKELYIKTFSLILLFNVVLITGILIFIPAISYIWIGKLVPFFIFAAIVNSLAAFLNICSNPAYFSYLGEGKLNWLMYSYTAITILNPFLGYVLGVNYGEYGVVVAWNTSFLIGSLLVLFSYHEINLIRWKELISIQDLFFVLVAISNTFLGFYLMQNLIKNIISYIHIFSFIICFTFFIYLFLKNKKIKVLTEKLLNIKTNV